MRGKLEAMTPSGPLVTIIGGGFAGSECAWQLSRRGHRARLHEMRPRVSTAAHETADLAEMVCSNSFRSDNPFNAVGLLKREMEALDSLVVACARQTRVPAGDALAVDRRAFSTLSECVLPRFDLTRLPLRHETRLRPLLRGEARIEPP